MGHFPKMRKAQSLTANTLKSLRGLQNKYISFSERERGRGRKYWRGNGGGAGRERNQVVKGSSEPECRIFYKGQCATRAKGS